MKKIYLSSALVPCHSNKNRPGALDNEVIVLMKNDAPFAVLDVGVFVLPKIRDFVKQERKQEINKDNQYYFDGDIIA